MRIVHISDWHGNLFPIPSADIYVVSGDMLPNFMVATFKRPDGTLRHQRVNTHLLGGEQIPADWKLVSRENVIPEDEVLYQEDFRKRCQQGEQLGFTDMMGSPFAPVVCVRGNHDFIDLEGFFTGGLTYEIGVDPYVTFDVLGLRFGGFRGIRHIAGEWSDELRPEALDDRARQLPECDVLVTHCPPEGILDGVDTGFGDLENVGCAALASRLMRPDSRVKLHCFGHIHGRHGMRTIGPTVFSNAATTVNVIDI